MYNLTQKFSSVDLKLPENVNQYGHNVAVNLTGDIVAISGKDRISVYKKYKNEYLPKCFDVTALTNTPYNIALTEQNVMYYSVDDTIVRYNLKTSDRSVLVQNSDKLFGKCLSVSRDNKNLMLASNSNVYKYDLDLCELKLIYSGKQEIVNVLAISNNNGFFCEFNAVEKKYWVRSYNGCAFPQPEKSCNVTGFGLSLSYCESTGLLAIGGPLNYFNKGAVWLVGLSQICIEPADSNIENFGSCVSLHNDILVIGHKTGVIIYQKKVDSWTIRQKIDALHVKSCELSADLSTLVIGCPDILGESVVYVYETDAFKSAVENLECSRNVVLKHRDVVYEMKIDCHDNLNLYKNAELVFGFDMFKTGTDVTKDYKLVYTKMGKIVNCVVQVYNCNTELKLPFKYDIPPPDISVPFLDSRDNEWNFGNAIFVDKKDDCIYLGRCAVGSHAFSYTTLE